MLFWDSQNTTLQFEFILLKEKHMFSVFYSQSNRTVI